VTTISATTALPRRSTYRLNPRVEPSSEVLPRTKSILQPASGKSLARNATLPSRYSVVEYISSLLAVRQELAATDEAISDTTVVCHFLFEQCHDRSILSSVFSTTKHLRRSESWMLLLQPLSRKRHRSHGGTTSVQASTSPALPDKRSQQEFSTASDGATVATAIGSRTEGQAIRGYGAFTAHEKDTRKVAAG